MSVALVAQGETDLRPAAGDEEVMLQQEAAIGEGSATNIVPVAIGASSSPRPGRGCAGADRSPLYSAAL